MNELMRNKGDCNIEVEIEGFKINIIKEGWKIVHEDLEVKK